MLQQIEKEVLSNASQSKLTEFNKQRVWWPNAFPEERKHDTFAYHAHTESYKSLYNLRLLQGRVWLSV